MDFTNLRDADFDRLNYTANKWIDKYAAYDNLLPSELHECMKNEIFRDEYVVVDVARCMRFYKPERV